MSIESLEYNGIAVLRCDGDKCNNFIEFSSFHKAVAFKKKQKEKEHGWRSYKEGDVWFDKCPDCMVKFARGEV